MIELTQQSVKEILDYDPETGVLSRCELDRRWFRRDQDWRGYSRRCVGLEVGSVTGSGYMQFSLLGKQALYVHRVIWLWMTGKWPSEIDHRDRDRQNNRWSNLREVTHVENGHNMRMNRNNTTGITGVYRKKSGKFWSDIYVDGQWFNVGTFDTLEQAAAARKVAECKYGFHVGHGT